MLSNNSSYSRVNQDIPPAYDEGTFSRSPDDFVPDDFKYSTSVAACDLPVRQMFIRKVYSLLTVQLMVTIIVGAIIHANDNIRLWCIQHLWLVLMTGLASIGLMIATSIKARSYPTNLILLGAFTLCEAYTVGVGCSIIETDILIQALGLTLITFIGLTLFAFQTKYDFISWQGAASMALWGLVTWSFFFMFFPFRSKGMELVYSGVGCLVFSVYVLIDTQRIMKTAHLDDEIVSAISLYLDILNLFLYVLRIMRERDN